MLSRHIIAAHTEPPVPGGMTKVEFERFLSKIELDANGCWLWTGGLDASGYGLCSVGYPAHTRRAHLVAYEHFIGTIPQGLTLDHLCRVPRCVNPTDTEPVTLVANVLRGEGAAVKNSRKTNCKNGHPFTAENTGYSRASKKRGGETKHRFCLICAAAAKRRHAQRKAGTA